MVRSYERGMSIEELQNLRDELLKRNDLFQKELANLKKKGKETFCKRWHVDIWQGGWRTSEPEDAVRISNISPRDARLWLQIDLRYSERKIMEEIAEIVGGLHGTYHGAMWWRSYQKLCREKKIASKEEIPVSLVEREKRQRVGLGPEHYWKMQDPDLYEFYLKVWDMKKKEGKSWRQIQKALNISDREYHNIRNAYTRVRRLIRKGVPYFPTFPDPN